MPGKLDKVALSFLVDTLEIRRGGVAANIAFGLGCLGLHPLLVGTTGADFAEYRGWLERHGVDCSGVRQSSVHHTARFISTTDIDLNQIASFYPGAMSEDVRHRRQRPGRADGPDLDRRHRPGGDVRVHRAVPRAGIPFAADTSWQLARMDGDQVRELVAGAAYLFSNEYEAELLVHKSGWTSDELTGQVGIRVTTLGGAGARVEVAGEPPVEVGALPDAAPREPTGAGDAFRAGFLAAVSWGLSLERAAQLGNMIAVHALETTGTQEYELKPAELAARLSAAYGPQAGDDVAAHFS